ncbi:Putative Phosphotransferase family protein [Penicillium brasilianum]|uniref:Putative Phosphotransferase family protein n=1 Tax=Penicillium brasilianum TaxID=104259 RepID=A0A0F7U3U0_PENBI|nr:Putative Phosphotransferase family protein [Penicillium brasilianum]
MERWPILRCFMPEFTWSDNNVRPISNETPPTPRPTPARLRRFWGFLHKYLRGFSWSYCSWVGIEYDYQIAQLPFGLILKWSDGTRLEEGEHPDTPHAPVSILMTRVPGQELRQVYETLSNEEQMSVLQELKVCVEVMRGWSNPGNGNRIYSLLGTAIRSVRVPNHYAGPFKCEEEFNDYLIQPSWPGGFASEAAYKDALDLAKGMRKLSHHVVFTHGDLKPHNILVNRGRITGFLDWQSAGWYPDYWDFTTALTFTREDFWWYSFVVDLGGGSYLAELECERALTSLTSASYYR